MFKGFKFVPIERENKMLKKNIQNYYTVEQMKSAYESLLSNEMQKVYSQEESNVDDAIKDKVKTFTDIIKDTINCDKISFLNNDCVIEINRKINLLEENKILDLISPFIVMDIMISEKDSKTILRISEEVDYCK